MLTLWPNWPADGDSRGSGRAASSITGSRFTPCSDRRRHLRQGAADRGQHGGVDVDELDECDPPLAVAVVGWATMKGMCAHGVVLVGLQLADPAVVAVEGAVVRGQDHDRVAPQVEPVHRVEERAQPRSRKATLAA